MRRLLRIVGIVALSAGCACPVAAQTYARFRQPDSLLAGVIRSSGGDFEPAWNALLVAELRAAEARADSAAGLRAIETGIAAHEEEARGSTIARDALALRARWNGPQRRLRVRAAVRESLATREQSGRRFERADSLFQLALADYRSLGERRREAWVLGSLGLVAFTSGDDARADSLYRLALAARRRIGDARMVGNSLNSLGSTNYRLGRYAEARPFLEEARTVRASTGERGAQGESTNLLALTMERLGAPDSARTLFDQALALTVAAGDSARTGLVLNNYMALLVDRGQLGPAVRLAERAVTIQQELGNATAEAKIHRNMGELLRQQGRFADAAERLDAAIGLSRDNEDTPGLVDGEILLGKLAVGVGDVRLGRAPLLEAVRLADSLSDPQRQAEALNNLAHLAEADDDLTGATRYATAALEKATALGDVRLTHDVAQTLGGLAMARGDTAATRTWYARAEASGRSLPVEDQASDSNNLGIAAIYGGDLESAAASFQRALDTAERAQAPDLAWPPLLGLGEVAERRADFAAALAYDRRAATLIDTLRARQGEEAPSIAVLAERRFAFEALIHLLTRLQGRFRDSAFVAEAFGWSERARARSLEDLIETGGRHAARVAPLDLERARAALPPRTAFLEYSSGDSSTSLWLLTRSQTRHFALPPRARLRTPVEILRRSLASVSEAESPAARRAARSLYQILLGPAEKDLKDIDRLVISPDGPLSLLPFEALLARDSGGDGPPPAAAYLVHRFAVSYVPSATVFAALGGAPGAGPIVALGDPAFRAAADQPGPALSELPNTAREIEAIGRLAGNRPVLRLEGAEATRERLLAAPELASAAVIHLATHGQADEFESARAGLWLAAGAEGPGFLSVADVLGLGLTADLVTLSACETGIGRVARGEGVLGLPRAFLAAGAHSVLVSLWKVNDRSAADLMEAFYRGLLADHEDGALALATAKRRMLDHPETRSPFHWAPFVLVGRAPEANRH